MKNINNLRVLYNLVMFVIGSTFCRMMYLYFKEMNRRRKLWIEKRDYRFDRMDHLLSKIALSRRLTIGDIYEILRIESRVILPDEDLRNIYLLRSSIHEIKNTNSINVIAYDTDRHCQKYTIKFELLGKYEDFPGWNSIKDTLVSVTEISTTYTPYLAVEKEIFGIK